MVNKMAPNDAVVYEENRNGITGSDALQSLGKIFDYARESKITEREIERYRAMRDVAITQIVTQTRITEKLIDKVFEERRRIIEKDFELIDAGMAKSDYTLIAKGLDHITSIVKDNPFKIFAVTNIQQRHKMLEDGEFSIE
jgi:hypothetical protein